MPTVTPPAITALPLPPDPNDRATFNTRAYPWSVAQQTFATQVGAVATNVKANADDAATSSTTATTQVTLATTQAGNAATSAGTATTQAGTATTQATASGVSAAASAASAVQASKLNLGSKASAPTVDNQGAALLTGAIYYDTTLAKWRVWSGSAWVDGLSAVAGVSAVNGTSGAVINIATTGANIFTGRQSFATGAAIASAGTLNLDAALDGNRHHITGTTAITAVTLTRGPRTLIFDGVLTLTHNATTNNLPGAANIITAVGDRAIYESDGTTVYCVSYIRASGFAVIGSVGDHGIAIHTGNGYGSTNTRIRRFTTTLTSVGTAITYADSATLGATLTINETGLYAIHYSDFQTTAATSFFGFSVNSSQLSTNIQTITVASRLAIAGQSFITVTTVASRVVRLISGDVVRPHTSATMDGATDLVFFAIRKVGI